MADDEPERPAAAEIKPNVATTKTVVITRDSSLFMSTSIIVTSLSVGIATLVASVIAAFLRAIASLINAITTLIQAILSNPLWFLIFGLLVFVGVPLWTQYHHEVIGLAQQTWTCTVRPFFNGIVRPLAESLSDIYAGAARLWNFGQMAISTLTMDMVLWIPINCDGTYSGILRLKDQVPRILHLVPPLARMVVGIFTGNVVHEGYLVSYNALFIGRDLSLMIGDFLQCYCGYGAYVFDGIAAFLGNNNTVLGVGATLNAFQELGADIQQMLIADVQIIVNLIVDVALFLANMATELISLMSQMISGITAVLDSGPKIGIIPRAINNASLFGARLSVIQLASVWTLTEQLFVDVWNAVVALLQTIPSMHWVTHHLLAAVAYLSTAVQDTIILVVDSILDIVKAPPLLRLRILSMASAGSQTIQAGAAITGSVFNLLIDLLRTNITAAQADLRSLVETGVHACDRIGGDVGRLRNLLTTLATTSSFRKNIADVNFGALIAALKTFDPSVGVKEALAQLGQELSDAQIVELNGDGIGFARSALMQDLIILLGNSSTRHLCRAAVRTLGTVIDIALDMRTANQSAFYTADCIYGELYKASEALGVEISEFLGSIPSGRRMRPCAQNASACGWMYEKTGQTPPTGTPQWDMIVDALLDWDLGRLIAVAQNTSEGDPMFKKSAIRGLVTGTADAAIGVIEYITDLVRDFIRTYAEDPNASAATYFENARRRTKSYDCVFDRLNRGIDGLADIVRGILNETVFGLQYGLAEAFAAGNVPEVLPGADLSQRFEDFIMSVDRDLEDPKLEIIFQSIWTDVCKKIKVPNYWPDNPPLKPSICNGTGSGNGWCLNNAYNNHGPSIDFSRLSAILLFRDSVPALRDVLKAVVELLRYVVRVAHQASPEKWRYRFDGGAACVRHWPCPDGMAGPSANKSCVVLDPDCPTAEMYNLPIGEDPVLDEIAATQSGGLVDAGHTERLIAAIMKIADGLHGFVDNIDRLYNAFFLRFPPFCEQPAGLGSLEIARIINGTARVALSLVTTLVRIIAHPRDSADFLLAVPLVELKDLMADIGTALPTYQGRINTTLGDVLFGDSTAWNATMRTIDPAKGLGAFLYGGAEVGLVINDILVEMLDSLIAAMARNHTDFFDFFSDVFYAGQTAVKFQDADVFIERLRAALTIAHHGITSLIVPLAMIEENGVKTLDHWTRLFADFGFGISAAFVELLTARRTIPTWIYPAEMNGEMYGHYVGKEIDGTQKGWTPAGYDPRGPVARALVRLETIACAIDEFGRAWARTGSTVATLSGRVIALIHYLVTTYAMNPTPSDTLAYKQVRRNIVGYINQASERAYETLCKAAGVGSAIVQGAIQLFAGIVVFVEGPGQKLRGEDDTEYADLADAAKYMQLGYGTLNARACITCGLHSFVRAARTFVLGMSFGVRFDEDGTNSSTVCAPPSGPYGQMCVGKTPIFCELSSLLGSFGNLLVELVSFTTGIAAHLLNPIPQIAGTRSPFREPCGKGDSSADSFGIKPSLVAPFNAATGVCATVGSIVSRMIRLIWSTHDGIRYGEVLGRVVSTSLNLVVLATRTVVQVAAVVLRVLFSIVFPDDDNPIDLTFCHAAMTFGDATYPFLLGTEAWARMWVELITLIAEPIGTFLSTIVDIYHMMFVIANSPFQRLMTASFNLISATAGFIKSLSGGTTAQAGQLFGNAIVEFLTSLWDTIITLFATLVDNVLFQGFKIAGRFGVTDCVRNLGPCISALLGIGKRDESPMLARARFFADAAIAMDPQNTECIELLMNASKALRGRENMTKHERSTDDSVDDITERAIVESLGMTAQTKKRSFGEMQGSVSDYAKRYKLVLCLGDVLGLQRDNIPPTKQHQATADFVSAIGTTVARMIDGLVDGTPGKCKADDLPCVLAEAARDEVASARERAIRTISDGSKQESVSTAVSWRFRELLSEIDIIIPSTSIFKTREVTLTPVLSVKDEADDDLSVTATVELSDQERFDLQTITPQMESVWYEPAPLDSVEHSTWEARMWKIVIDRFGSAAERLASFTIPRQTERRHTVNRLRHSTPHRRTASLIPTFSSRLTALIPARRHSDLSAEAIRERRQNTGILDTASITSTCMCGHQTHPWYKPGFAGLEPWNNLGGPKCVQCASEVPPACRKNELRECVSCDDRIIEAKLFGDPGVGLGADVQTSRTSKCPDWYPDCTGIGAKLVLPALCPAANRCPTLINDPLVRDVWDQACSPMCKTPAATKTFQKTCFRTTENEWVFDPHRAIMWRALEASDSYISSSALMLYPVLNSGGEVTLDKFYEDYDNTDFHCPSCEAELMAHMSPSDPYPRSRNRCWLQNYSVWYTPLINPLNPSPSASIAYLRDLRANWNALKNLSVAGTLSTFIFSAFGNKECGYLARGVVPEEFCRTKCNAEFIDNIMNLTVGSIGKSYGNPSDPSYFDNVPTNAYARLLYAALFRQPRCDAHEFMGIDVAAIIYGLQKIANTEIIDPNAYFFSEENMKLNPGVALLRSFLKIYTDRSPYPIINKVARDFVNRLAALIQDFLHTTCAEICDVPRPTACTEHLPCSIENDMRSFTQAYRDVVETSYAKSIYDATPSSTCYWLVSRIPSYHGEFTDTIMQICNNLGDLDLVVAEYSKYIYRTAVCSIGCQYAPVPVPRLPQTIPGGFPVSTASQKQIAAPKEGCSVAPKSCITHNPDAPVDRESFSSCDCPTTWWEAQYMVFLLQQQGINVTIVFNETTANYTILNLGKDYPYVCVYEITTDKNELDIKPGRLPFLCPMLAESSNIYTFWTDLRNILAREELAPLYGYNSSVPNNIEFFCGNLCPDDTWCVDLFPINCPEALQIYTADNADKHAGAKLVLCKLFNMENKTITREMFPMINMRSYVRIMGATTVFDDDIYETSACKTRNNEVGSSIWSKKWNIETGHTQATTTTNVGSRVIFRGQPKTVCAMEAPPLVAPVVEDDPLTCNVLLNRIKNEIIETIMSSMLRDIADCYRRGILTDDLTGGLSRRSDTPKPAVAPAAAKRVVGDDYNVDPNFRTIGNWGYDRAIDPSFGGECTADCDVARNEPVAIRYEFYKWGYPWVLKPPSESQCVKPSADERLAVCKLTHPGLDEIGPAMSEELQFAREAVANELLLLGEQMLNKRRAESSLAASIRSLNRGIDTAVSVLNTLSTGESVAKRSKVTDAAKAVSPVFRTSIKIGQAIALSASIAACRLDPRASACKRAKLGIDRLVLMEANGTDGISLLRNDCYLLCGYNWSDTARRSCLWTVVSQNDGDVGTAINDFLTTTHEQICDAMGLETVASRNATNRMAARVMERFSHWRPRELGPIRGSAASFDMSSGGWLITWIRTTLYGWITFFINMFGGDPRLLSNFGLLFYNPGAFSNTTIWMQLFRSGVQFIADKVSGHAWNATMANGTKSFVDELWDNRFSLDIDSDSEDFQPGPVFWVTFLFLVDCNKLNCGWTIFGYCVWSPFWTFGPISALKAHPLLLHDALKITDEVIMENELIVPRSLAIDDAEIQQCIDYPATAESLSFPMMDPCTCDAQFYSCGERIGMTSFIDVGLYLVAALGGESFFSWLDTTYLTTMLWAIGIDADKLYGQFANYSSWSQEDKDLALTCAIILAPSILPVVVVASYPILILGVLCIDLKVAGLIFFFVCLGVLWQIVMLVGRWFYLRLGPTDLLRWLARRRRESLSPAAAPPVGAEVVFERKRNAHKKRRILGAIKQFACDAVCCYSDDEMAARRQPVVHMPVMTTAPPAERRTKILNEIVRERMENESKQKLLRQKKKASDEVYYYGASDDQS